MPERLQLLGICTIFMYLPDTAFPTANLRDDEQDVSIVCLKCRKDVG